MSAISASNSNTYGQTAGPSFEVFYGSGYLLPHAQPAWIVFHERLLELRAYLETLPETCWEAADLARAAGALEGLARRLEGSVEGLSERGVAAPPAWLHGQTVPVARGADGETATRPE
jgi:hypothetical protein